MSSDPRGGAVSPRGDGPAGPGPEVSLATLVRVRGATLLDALERHLPGSLDHADGTAAYAFAVSAELNPDRAHAEIVREAARLHEIGMVYLPAGVLGRPREELSPQEAGLLDSHPAYGALLAAGAAIPDQACGWIGAAGERFDGTGAWGLAGERIPLEARMIRVACACDSLLAARLSPGRARAEVAITELRASAGRDLDPRVVEAVSAIVDRAASAAG
jgi:HD-GYP domain-containing protein (c-di-GMP phosphodiesterase class II)